MSLKKVIAENSGHRSTKALCCYEQTSTEQQRAVSRVNTDPLKPFEIVEASKTIDHLHGRPKEFNYL